VDWFLELLAKFRSDENLQQEQPRQHARPHPGWMLPDTLPTEDWEQMLWDSGHRDKPDRAQYSPSRLYGLWDSLQTTAQSAAPDRLVPRVARADELLDWTRSLSAEVPEEYFRGELMPTMESGAYLYDPDGETTPVIFIQPHQLYGAASATGFPSHEITRRPSVDPENDPARGTLIHEMMHHISPERDEYDYYARAHGPYPYSANVLHAAFDALASVPQGDTVDIDEVAFDVVVDYPKYKSLGAGSRDLSRKDAKESVEWLAQQDPFRGSITLEEENIVSKILSLLGLGGNR